MDWGTETRAIQECETDRKHILNWLQDKGYYSYTTGEEQAMFELPVGAKKFKKDELIEIDVQSKAMDILLWTLCKTSLIPDLSEAAISDNHKILNISRDHDFETEVSLCGVKLESEIVLQADIAYLWNWRMNRIDVHATKGANHNITDMITQQFVHRYDEALRHIEVYYPRTSRSSSDFVAWNLVIRELYSWQIKLMKYFTYWRYYAFRWILDNDDWDKIKF